MTNTIAKRTVQLAGWVSIVFGALLVIFAVTSAVQAWTYRPSGVSCPACGIAIMPTFFDIFTIAYLVFIGVVLFIFGNRIRQLNRQDIPFYLFAGLAIDLSFIFIDTSPSHVDILRFALSILCLLHLLCIFTLIPWYRYVKKENLNLIPGASWWYKIALTLFIVVAPILIRYFLFYLQGSSY